MGRKMDALLRRGFRASKFKTLAKLAIDRLAILKKQRSVRSSNARVDVVQLLKLGHQDRALLRVEHVIKEQNMVDLFVMMEGFINLLTERIALLQDAKKCPDELEEAISSLIFASTRCGEFPELKYIRETFTSRFGKEFAASAEEERNTYRVHPKIIQRLSTRKPTSENKLKILKEIASESGITLKFEEEHDVKQEKKQRTLNEPTDIYNHESEDELNYLAEKLSELIKAKKFEASIDLSRADPRESDDNGDEIQEETRNTTDGFVISYDDHQESSPEAHDDGDEIQEETKNSIDELIFNKIDSRNSSSTDSDDDKDNNEEKEEFYSFKNSKVIAREADTEAENTVSLSISDLMGPDFMSESDNDDTNTDSNDKNEISIPIHLKSQTDFTNHGTDRKSRLGSAQTFSDFGQRSRAQQSGADRKLMSVRTISVVRS